MNDEGVHRKLAAIFHSDVVGYSKLMADDELATISTISEYRDVMAKLILQHRGRVVDTSGDNVLAEFSSVVDAMQGAVAIQKELKVRNSRLPEHRWMQFRIGLNIGEVIQEGERIYGDGVNIAARLETLAKPGGICLSRVAYDQIESKLPLGYEYIGEQPLKNIRKPLHAYRVVLEDDVSEAKTDKEIKEDEHIGETNNQVKGRSHEISEGPETRTGILHKLAKSKDLKIFFGIALFLFLLNALTSFGDWWFIYPVLTICLVFYLNWLKNSLFSMEQTEALRQKLIHKELSKMDSEISVSKYGMKRAQMKVDKRIEFYNHLFVYAGVNVFLFIINLLLTPFAWWFPFPLTIWGFFVFINWLKIRAPLPEQKG